LLQFIHERLYVSYFSRTVPMHLFLVTHDYCLSLLRAVESGLREKLAEENYVDGIRTRYRSRYGPVHAAAGLLRPQAHLPH